MFLIPLNKPEKREKICNCLSEIFGMTCEFTATGEGQKENGGTNGEKEFLNSLYDTFGAEKVVVQE